MPAAKWPNWIDLLLLTIIIRGCYVGYNRGLVPELAYWFGVAISTVLACKYYVVLATWIGPYWQFDPGWLQSVCFILLLLVSLLFVYRMLHRAAPLLMREQFQRPILQVLGLIVGGLRGAWWAGLTVLLLLALGIPYLTTSILERSIVGAKVAEVAGQSFRGAANFVPGSPTPQALIPGMKLGNPRLPLPAELQPAPAKR